jgi:hypothetical protein
MEIIGFPTTVKEKVKSIEFESKYMVSLHSKIITEVANLKK